MMTQIKTEAELSAMRQGGKILATVLTELSHIAQPGMTKRELDEYARRRTKDMGGEPSFLGYNGFPAGLCVSINDEVTHGIPDNTKLAEGDLLGLDYGVTVNGMIVDSAITIPIGRVSDEASRLLSATEKSLYAGIAEVKAGVAVGTIGAAIEQVIDQAGFAVIYNLVGHGVGHKVHEDPFVPNNGPAGTGAHLKAGMTVAIEPNVSLSSHDFFVDPHNHWACRSSDGSLTAQFEHTILVTENGYEILTQL